VKKILSIDDEPLMLKCLEKSLQSRGYQLFVTDDPAEALRIYTTEDIALVLLDIRMPKKSGFDLYREFRQIRKVPVLFVTAYSKSFTTRSADVAKMWREEFAEGTTDVIYKPFDLQLLFDKVEALIGGPDADAPQAAGA
jgi:DNA-binding response OmpR family regulator